MNYTKITLGLITALGTITSGNTLAEESGNNADTETEQIIIIGSRSNPRTVADSPVPVDLVSAEQLNSIGNSADLTDALNVLIPSYSAQPAVNNGSSFIRPTSLRGLAPDQTLVLVNGKRRHRSALVQVNAPGIGQGAHSADIGMIPSIAMKSIEVLRDGAAAQYGADAIAGVINFVPKDDSEGGSAILQYGQFYEGEQSVKFAANAGFELGEKGFINLSMELVDNEALSRGTQNTDAQALIDSGVQGIGQDSPFDDKPLAQTFGRPETDAQRFFFNSGYDLNNDSQAYLQGNYSKATGIYRFFYRQPASDTIGRNSNLSSLVNNFGYDGALLDVGYTPYLEGEQTDYSLLGGTKGLIDDEIAYDISISLGNSQLDYTLYNSLNLALGLGSDGEPLVRNFDIGGFEQEEIGINLDFSQDLNDTLSLAYGVEWRRESFTVNAGDTNSTTIDEDLGLLNTVDGFAGIKPSESGEFSRNNYAIYVDAEQYFTDDFLLQGALRYEDFSDFGDTINGKLAMSWHVSDEVILRSAISTGFHAPTPGQANLRNTTTAFINNTLVEEGLVPPTSPEAIAAGGTALTEEKSLNFSAGIVFSPTDDVTLTIDAYKIEIDGKIYNINNIENPLSPGSSISFYSNALDIESEGIDAILTTSLDWNDSVSTNFSFAYNYNKVSVTDIATIQTPNGPITPVNDDTIDDIENTLPSHRFVISANTEFNDKWSLSARANFIGSHYDIFLSQRRDPCEAGAPPVNGNCPSFKAGSIVYVDVELTYKYSDNWKLALGATNLFDEYPEEVPSTNASFEYFGLPYGRSTAQNYEGGSWYLRTEYMF